jgi:hypothetical protein
MKKPQESQILGYVFPRKKLVFFDNCIGLHFGQFSNKPSDHRDGDKPTFSKEFLINKKQR